MDDGSIIDMDISRQTDRIAWDHNELSYFNNASLPRK